MNFKLIAIASLAVTVLLAAVAPFFLPLHFVSGSTGYSGTRFTRFFPQRPSEAELLDWAIRSDPAIEDPELAIDQWRKVMEDGHSLKIKLDSETSLALKPYDSADTPDLIFADGGRKRGIWMTEPATRIEIPAPLTLAAFSAIAFSGLFLIGLIFNTFVILWCRSWLGLYLERKRLEEKRRVDDLRASASTPADIH